MNVKPKIWRDVFERDKAICQYCGLDFLSHFSLCDSATVDHIIARSEGCDDSLKNLVACCPSCNSGLSRAGKLKTFEDRKNYIQKRIQKKLPDFEEWKNELRKIGNMENLGEVKAKIKTGMEELSFNGNSIDYNLLDFWIVSLGSSPKTLA